VLPYLHRAAFPSTSHPRMSSLSPFGSKIVYDGGIHCTICNNWTLGVNRGYAAAGLGLRENSKMSSNKSVSRQGIQSIEIGNRLIVALAEASTPLMLRDLAKSARMPPSKAHRYLVSFARGGLVVQEAESGRYDLGPLALQLGLAALRRMDAVGLAMPSLRNLSDDIKQTVALAVWANHGATIIRWLGTDAPVAATLRVGSIMPLTRSATGLVFIAHQPQLRWRSLVTQELAENRRNGLRPQSLSDLQRPLEQIQRDGYAVTSSFIPGISGMAAPVFAEDGSVALAIVTLGHSASFDQSRDRIAASLIAESRRLSARLGFEVIDGVFGSLRFRGKPKSLSDFDAGIRREIRGRHGRR
jgi:DNA-binding IclR family transcriptional regulator